MTVMDVIPFSIIAPCLCGLLPRGPIFLEVIILGVLSHHDGIHKTEGELAEYWYTIYSLVD